MRSCENYAHCDNDGNDNAVGDGDTDGGGGGNNCNAFTSSQHCARCVPEWRYMVLLNNPSNTGFTAVRV